MATTLTVNNTTGYIGINTVANINNNINIYNNALNSSNQLLITSTCNFANIQLTNEINSNAFIGLGCSNISGNYTCNLFIETNKSIIINANNINKLTTQSQSRSLIISSNGYIAVNYNNDLNNLYDYLPDTYNLSIYGITSSNFFLNGSKIYSTTCTHANSINYPTCIVNNNIYAGNELSNLIYNIAFDIASPIKRYPPKTYDSSTQMTSFTNNTITNYSNTFTINDYQNGYGIGTYKVITSSGGIETNKDFLKSRLLFNLTNNSTDEINSNGFLFDSNIDNYNNIGNYIKTNNIDGSYLGGWIKIQFPESIILRKFAFSSYAKSGFTINDYKYLPGSWKCYGSIDNITYTEIPEANSTYRITDKYYFNNQLKYTHYLANTFNKSYNYIAWTFNQLSGTNINTNNSLRHLYEIEIYADDLRLNILNKININNRYGLGPPSFYTIYGSNGDRIILKEGINDTVYPYSIGMNSNTMWFSVPTNGSYLWYSNLTSNMFLDKVGTLNVFNDIIGFNNASDSNLKTNIKSFDFNCIDIINKIKPVEFTWKDIAKVPENKKNTIDYGFIAQEIEELLPHIVKETSEYKIIKYEKMIPYLVKAIQELNIRLKNKIIKDLNNSNINSSI